MFASTVYDQNARLIDAGLTPVNLSSIMIGLFTFTTSKEIPLSLSQETGAPI